MKGFIVIVAAYVGLGVVVAACLSEPKSPAPTATPARLIGSCGGQVLAGMQEDEFPQGCDWIEPIQYRDSEVTSD